MNVGSTLGKIILVAVVRDCNGNPKFDDYNNIPSQFELCLTDEDREFIKTKIQERN